MADPVVVSALRTATGRFGGALQDVPAADLGGKVLAAALAECQVEASEVDEVLMGMVYQGGAGANPARQAAIAAELPYEVPSMTVNKLCGSGLKAIGLAAQSLRAGEAEVVLAGGMENMSSGTLRPARRTVGAATGARPSRGHADARWVVGLFLRLPHGGYGRKLG